MKHWWTAEECAALFVGADPHFAQNLVDPHFPVNLVPEIDREKFGRVLDLINRRFGARVNPAEASQWAASIGMKQECLEQALTARGAPEARVAKHRSQGSSKVRQEDITKLDITRSQIISAVAKNRGFREDKHNDAVQRFKKDLEKIGRGNMDEKTVRDCIIDATKHAQTKKPFAEFYADGQESRKVARRPRGETSP
jgi:hypothetical protein